MLASRWLKASRSRSYARPFRREPVAFSLSHETLARCAAVALCLCAAQTVAFAQEATVAAPPKVQNAKKAQKKSSETRAKEKAPNEGPAQPAVNGPEGAAAVTSTRPAKEEKVAPLAALPQPDTATPPPRLPGASREKMHACAIEWSKLKLEARNPMPLWRDFGAKCLTR